MSNFKINEKAVVDVSTPTKPSTDKKEYRCFTLANDMKITVISDPETDKSAVSMDVHIGSLSDPKSLAGLAHFCEHMVFMGSSKYPEENYYSKYLSQHNGQFNAYTAFDHTNFYFSIKPENLFEAVDIFAQFFISPLFTESATDREIQAVNSEHEKNICNDFRRKIQLDHHLSDKNHDYNKFATGNLKTLKEDPELNNINVRQSLLDFHNSHYSSNIMSLCILGKESLDQLQNLIVDLFSPVLNKNIAIPHWDSHPWTEGHIKQIVYVTPIQDCYELFILWPIPDYSKLYKSKPDRYISHLIGHEGEGSILSLLKKKGWSNTLCAGEHNVADGICAMVITIDLFEEGINHIDEILTIIYQYCHILKSQEPQQWIFDEMKKIQEMKFRFRETSNLETLVSQITHDRRLFDSEHILEGPYVMIDFRPDLITKMINCLIPSQMKVYCSAKKFESKCTEEELWYKTKYVVENFSSEQIKMWENVEFHSELSLPVENVYIPTDFTIRSPNEDAPSGPELLRNGGLSRWWFCQDNSYLLPKAFIFINMTSTLAARDPVYSIMDLMIADLFSDAVNEQTYEARLANLEFGIGVNSQGLKMHFAGYNEKMPVFVNDIINKLAVFVPKSSQFEAIKENRFRSLRNFDTERPIYQADHLLSCLTTEVMWHHDDLLSTINDITMENFLSYMKMFFSQFHMEGLIYGNFKSNEAYSIMNDIEMIFTKHFCTKPLLKSQLSGIRETLLPENSNYVFHYTNCHQPTSVLMTYLQGLDRTIRNNVITKLCDELLSEPLFNKLRTEEQLGYIVGSGIKMSNSMQGNRVYLQSAKKPSELDSRVKNFLVTFKTELDKMPEEEFQKYVVALKNKILEKPKDMLKQVSKYWSEISCKHYNFKRGEEEAAQLMTLSKNDMIEYYNRYIDPESKYLKKLSVYITSEETHGASSGADGDPLVTVVDDIVRFKKTLPLSPLIESVLPPVKEVPTAKL